MTLKTLIRASKIQDVENVDVLRSPDIILFNISCQTTSVTKYRGILSMYSLKEGPKILDFEHPLKIRIDRVSIAISILVTDVVDQMC